MVELSALLSPGTTGLTPIPFRGTDSESIDSFAQQLARAVQRILGQSESGTHIEIGTNPVQGAASDQSAGSREFTITVKETSVPMREVAKGGPAMASPAAGLVETGSAGSPIPKHPFPMFENFGSPFLIERELPSTPIVPPKAPPAAPVRFIAPPAEYVKTTFGNTTIITLESYMQKQLELLENGGAGSMVRGTQDWDLPHLLDNMYSLARSLAEDNEFADPRSAPANWKDVAAQYRNTFLDWLSQTDAGNYDPKLSGPIYDPATRTVQTSAGPLTYPSSALTGIPSGVAST